MTQDVGTNTRHFTAQSLRILIIVHLLCRLGWQGLELGAFRILLLYGFLEDISAHPRNLPLLLLVLNLIQEGVLDDLWIDLLMEAGFLCRFIDP